MILYLRSFPSAQDSSQAPRSPRERTPTGCLPAGKVAAPQGCLPIFRYMAGSMAASSVAEDAGMATGVSQDVRRLVIAMSGIVLLIALAFLTPRILYALSHVTTDDAYVDAYAAVVSARVPGAVVSIPVQEGEAVKRGEVL